VSISLTGPRSSAQSSIKRMHIVMTARKYGLLFCAGFLLALPLALVSPQQANAQNVDKTKIYLALGDSVPFGYNPLIPPRIENFMGYPDLVAESLGRELANGSCIFETSDSFLFEDAPDLGCDAWRTVQPLHVSYTGTQIDYADQFVQQHPKSELVSLQIGGNDLVPLQLSCAPPNPDPVGCFLQGLGPVLANLGQNLTTIHHRIFPHLKNSAKVVAVNYNAFHYGNPPEVAAFSELNRVIALVTSSFGGGVADAFTAFQTAADPFDGDTCAAGLRLPLGGGLCDTHPSAAGHALIAATVLNALRKPNTEDTTCSTSLTGILKKVIVPPGATCILANADVSGNVEVKPRGALTITGATRIGGNLQSDGGRYVRVLGAGVTIVGNAEVKKAQEWSGYEPGTQILGNFQYEESSGLLRAQGGRVQGNVQISKNTGGGTVSGNTIRQNLQCSENRPAPQGGGNLAGGNKQGQCAGL
jgi:hypothetical protein